MFAKTIKVVLVHLSSFSCWLYTRTNFPSPKADVISFGTKSLWQGKIVHFLPYARANKTCRRKLEQIKLVKESLSRKLAIVCTGDQTSLFAKAKAKGERCRPMD